MPFPKPKINKLGEPAKRPAKGIPLVDSQIAELLTKHLGNVSKVADCMGCSRQAVDKHIKASPELLEIRLHARQRFVDELETCTWQDALDNPKEASTRIFLLKTLARDRGYELVDNQNQVQDIAKAAFDYVLNRTKNPAE